MKITLPFAFLLIPTFLIAQPIIRKSTQEGITVTTTIESKNKTLQEGDTVKFTLRITDQSNTPITNARPAAWMDGKTRLNRPDACKDRISVYAGGGFLGRAEVDLNVFHVLALNEDATITVVDPLFGFGGTKLLAMVELAGPGEDWVLSEDLSRLYVSVPSAKHVAVVDTTAWKVKSTVPLPSAPHRLVLQPDGAYLWAATDGGVAAIRTRDLALAAHIATAPGGHDLAATHDNRHVLVTNADAGSVTLIDVRTLRAAHTLDLEAKPVSIAWSSLASAAYVASADGTVVVIGGDRRKVIARMKSDAELVELRLAPSERFALVTDAKNKAVHVIDTASNRVIQTAHLTGTPDQLAFSNQLAYVRLRDSEDVQTIALTELGGASKELAPGDFPGGQNHLGGAGTAPGIVQAAGEDAVLVANPADRAIYYYREGMAAPMGSFTNYGRRARAVTIVDRSLRERAPGVYETVARVDHPGTFDVAVLVTSPRAVDCFQVAVAPDPKRVANEKEKPSVKAIGVSQDPTAGNPVTLTFRVLDPAGKALAVEDGFALVFAAGTWQGRPSLRPSADGTYAVDFTPPAPGLYAAYLQSPSLGLDYAFLGSISVGK